MAPVTQFSALDRANARIVGPEDSVSQRISIDLILRATVWDSLNHTLFGNIARPMRATAPRSVNEIPWYGQQEAHRVAYFDIIGRLDRATFRHEDAVLLDIQATIVRSTGWWWAFDGVCVLAERPAVLCATPTTTGVHNERWLHNASGPAVEFADGSGVYAYDGIVVPEWVICDPTAERIAREPDPAIRRCAIARFGAERYLEEARMRLVGADDDARLYSDGRRQLLVLGQPATATLNVPASAQSAREALAWTRGLRGDAA